MNIWLSLMQTVSKSLQADRITDKGLDLQTGEVVYGTLLEMVDQETGIFDLKGKPVRAQIELPLPVGARIPMLVTGIRENGQLELKVLTDESLRSATPAQSFAATDERTAYLPEPMTRPRLPDPAGTTSTINSKLPQVPQKNHPFLERLLLNLGLSPTPLLRTISQSLLQAKVSIQPAVLQNMEQIVQQELHAYTASQSKEPESAEIERITNSTVAILTGMAQKQIPLTAQTYGSIKALWQGPALHHLLNDPELPAELRSELVSSFMLDTSQLDSLSTAERGDLLAAAAKRIGLTHETQLTLGMIAQPFQSLEQGDTLKSLLLKEQQQQPGSKALDQVVTHVTGQQLMHSARDDQSPFCYQFVSLPMFVDKQPANAEIHVLSRKMGSRRVDPDNCYLYFHLSMPSLGEIGIHVQVLERLVALRLIAEQDSCLNLPESDLNDLQAGLEQAGYKLGTVRKETGSPNNRSPFAELPITVSAAGVDFRI